MTNQHTSDSFSHRPVITPPINTQEEKIVSSGIIVFRKTSEGPRFLMLYYGHSYWTFPRGKIEEQERSFAAALRETREETGFTRADLTFVECFKTREQWTFMRGTQKIHRTIIFYLAETQRSHVRVSDEHQGYGWFTYREAMKVLIGKKNGENRRVLKHAFDFIEHKRSKISPHHHERKKHDRFIPYGGKAKHQESSVTQKTHTT